MKSIVWSRVSPFEWLFVILGGLPLYLPVLFWMGEAKLSGREPIYWYYWVNACISAPHVYSTYGRLARKISEGRVHWAIGAPLYLLCVGALALASLKGFYLEALTAVNVWQSLHYFRQVYGISRIYGGTANEDEILGNLAFFSYHLAVPLFVLGRWDTLYTVWGGRPSDAIIPVRFSPLLMTSCWALAGAGLLAGLAAEAIKYRRGDSYHPAGLVTLIVSFGVHWLGFLSVAYYQRGFFAVTIFHAVQYIALVWVRERERGRLAAYARLLPEAGAFPLFWLLIFMAGYAFETYLLPGGNRWWPAFAAVLLAGVSAHHYAVDTFIWRRTAGP